MAALGTLSFGQLNAGVEPEIPGGPIGALIVTLISAVFLISGLNLLAAVPGERRAWAESTLPSRIRQREARLAEVDGWQPVATVDDEEAGVAPSP